MAREAKEVTDSYPCDVKQESLLRFRPSTVYCQPLFFQTTAPSVPILPAASHSIGLGTRQYATELVDSLRFPSQAAKYPGI